jgi:hypothetical protein
MAAFPSTVGNHSSPGYESLQNVKKGLRRSPWARASRKPSGVLEKLSGGIVAARSSYGNEPRLCGLPRSLPGRVRRTSLPHTRDSKYASPKVPRSGTGRRFPSKTGGFGSGQEQSRQQVPRDEEGEDEDRGVEPRLGGPFAPPSSTRMARFCRRMARNSRRPARSSCQNKNAEKTIASTNKAAPR